MKRYTQEELRLQFKKFGYVWSDFHLIGIRSLKNEKNKFDDLFILVNKNNTFYYSCTTEPGVTWLKKLLNPKGTAILRPGQYIDSWKIGLHQGKYEALTQCKPVTVFRDKDMDDMAEETSITDVGMFGINIHRANPKLTSILVDGWSAGCQVLNNPVEFGNLLASCKLSKKQFFTYTLLKEF